MDGNDTLHQLDSPDELAGRYTVFPASWAQIALRVFASTHVPWLPRSRLLPPSATPALLFVVILFRYALPLNVQWPT
jgi:hypothetical protein